MNHEERKKEAGKSPSRSSEITLEGEEANIFSDWLTRLNATGIPYVVGGAFALQHYTGIWRFTKDLDIFLKPDHLKTALDALSEAGYNTDVTDTCWLAKTTSESYLLDMIFSVANGYIAIDDSWFETSLSKELAGVSIRIMGPEEMIASKVYVTRSDRFDGADILHIIRCLRGDINWERLLRLIKDDGLLVLWYLILFSYVYPGHLDYLPRNLMADLYRQLMESDPDVRGPEYFLGTMMDPDRFMVDLKDWGYKNMREPMCPLVDEKGNKL